MPPDQDSWLDEVFESDSDDSWSAQMDARKPWGEGMANIVMPNATAGENVVLCAAGWGDGVYPVLGSYDSAGNLLAVHIDLLVEEEEDAAEDAATGPAKLSLWRRWFFPPRQG
jgi:hypothetical protein